MRLFPAHAALLLGWMFFSGCAPGKVTDGPKGYAWSVAGERYTVEVYNPTSCPASVFLRHNWGMGRGLGTVPPYGREVFQVSHPQDGLVAAHSLEPDGTFCGGARHNRVEVRRLEPADGG